MHRATIRFRHVVTLVILAVFSAVLSETAVAGDIAKPLGSFSDTVRGSFAFCVEPTTFAPEPCTTKGVLILTYSFLAVGAETVDATGACITTTAVNSPLPPSAFSPVVDRIDHLAIRLLDYDVTTGTGDVSFTGYDGGKCVGAKFDSKGATETNSGTNHIVVSQSGNRIDAVTTSVTNKENSYGSFLFHGVDLKQ